MSTGGSTAGGVALVTGGSAGIGRAICERFVADGRRVVSLDRDPPAAPDPRIEHVAVDLFDRAAVARAAADVAGRHGVGTLVHNAGVIRPALLPDIDLADLDALAQLHLGAAVALAQAVLPAMRAARFGRIVLVSSRAALGVATRSSYSATKAALIGMARTWALELGKDGITVNAVAPGPIATAMLRGVIPEGTEREEKLRASIPVGRLGEAADVANAVAFFAAPAAGFVTGQVLYVCGGSSIGGVTV